MNRNVNPSLLQPTEYGFMLNGNTESQVGDRLNVINEPSNRLTTVFPDGMKVIGVKKDLLSNRTYFHLTNPETKKSSIGYIENTILDVQNTDDYVECTDCKDNKNELSIPLEDTVQIPTNAYTELINDDCYEIGEGLNYDINFPIKFIELKQESLGTNMYWNDYRNNPRWMRVDDVEYLFKNERACDTPEILDCFDVDKLLQFPKHTQIQLEVEAVQTGGNLKLGTYEFYAAYSDSNGNEITEYSVPVNPISIFDENNNLLELSELDSFTNYAIKIKVNNLDQRFRYYRLVCIEKTSIQSVESIFEVGVFPTSDDTVLYTTSGSLNDNIQAVGNVSLRKRVSREELFAIKPIYDKAKGLVSSSGRLFQWGLTRRPEMNLQPVVNLMGSLMKWQTSIAKEDLYKDPVATSKYKGYTRNEVQPLAIRFLTTDGDRTPQFPIIARPATEYDLEIIQDGDTNKDSISSNSSECYGELRNKRWQIYNTATEEGICDNFSDNTIEIEEPLTRTCEIESVAIIPENSTTLQLDVEFTNLRDYIEDNPDITIPEITPYLTDTYPDMHCAPLFGTIYTEGLLEIGKKYIIYNLQLGDNFSNVGFLTEGETFIAIGTTPVIWENNTEVVKTFCDTPELIEQENLIGEILNENVTLIEAEFPNEYSRITPPRSCSIYKANYSNGGSYIVDFEFSYKYLYDPILLYLQVYSRDYAFGNENCYDADPIINIANTSDVVQSYFHNYFGADTLSELQTSKNASCIDPTSSAQFTDKIHKGVLWYRAERNNRDALLLEVSRMNNIGDQDDNVTAFWNPMQMARVSIFADCSAIDPIYCEILSLKDSYIQYRIQKTPTGIIINNGTSSTTIAGTSLFENYMYVAIDMPIVPAQGVEEWNTEGDQDAPVVYGKFRTSPLDGCYSIVTRNLTYTEAIVSWDSITINKKETYQSLCTFNIPDIKNCEPVPYSYGDFAYWESTEQYPDNAQLYDSSTLKITPADLSEIIVNDKIKFEQYFTQGIDTAGAYILKEDTNFACKSIRHPKLPDNTVAPFMSEFNLPSFSESYIFPMGVMLDSELVKAMLRVALNNNLITKKEFDSIQGYEILKADNTVSKSVIANGISFDMYKYTKKGKDYLYSNYPYNDLGEDLLHKDAPDGELIQHPFNGERNNRYSFISPDLFLNNTVIPSEVVFSGYQIGSTKGQFTTVEGHPKWTILGGKAKNLALTLAIAESALELAIKIGELTASQWFIVGTAGGTSLGYVGVGVVVAGYALNSVTQIGQYKYEWLKIFEDLGTRYNFAAYNVSTGYYNTFIKNTSENDYLRALSLRKPIKDGRYSYLDQGSGERIYVNNFKREHSTLLSTGNFFFNYSDEYIQYDNNLENSNSSRTLLSQNGCELEEEYVRNVGSPYFTLKNYVPDQFGTIDSLKWLTTNQRFDLNESTRCKPIFGGNVFISRFAWKRKIPIFSRTSMGQADNVPFNYRDYKNVGYPRFFCDYKVDSQSSILGIPFPDIDSEYNFDCQPGGSRFYVRPSYIYLYSYGIVDFLVESEINCNFRYGKASLKDNFYPQIQDLVEWTQEKNVPISEPNTFYYNNNYSAKVSNTPYKTLDRTYNKEQLERLYKQDNALIYSEFDNSENDVTDPWLIYKPLNYYQFPTKYGKLLQLKDIESNQILGRFENQQVVFNAVDNLADRITPANMELGTAGIFSTRPLEFPATDLGYGGTQHTEMLSTPFGHFSADAKRGQIFNLDQSGRNLQPISEKIGNEESGLKNWFREQLPFKILKYFPTADVDNKYKGLGLSMGWDARHNRVFITKKDYIPAQRCRDLSCDTSNLIVNGTFDNDLQGWTIDEEAPGITVQDGKAWFSDSNDISPILSQNILEVGKIYRVSFDLYMNPNCVAGGFTLQSIRVIAGTNQTAEITRLGTTKFEIEIECTGNTLFGIQMRYGCNYDFENLNTISVDNVCVVDVRDVVIPQLGDPDCILQENCLEYIEGQGFVHNQTACGEFPQIPVCPQGYTYNSDSQTCVLDYGYSACPDGFTYNPETQMCERQRSGCSEGLDIVFILDTTSSQGGALESIRSSIQTGILPAIVSNFGMDYRLGLVSVRDRRIAGQSLFDILTPMTMTNESEFQTAIDGILASGGAGSAEPTDEALKAVLNNTQEVDLNGDTVPSPTIGIFRENSAKAIILCTDNPPSGLDDVYNFNDWVNVDILTNQASEQGIQIFPYLTIVGINPVEPTPTAPTPPSIAPNVTWLMQNYANVTNGTYAFKPNGLGLGESVVENIVNDIGCIERLEPSCTENCEQIEGECLCDTEVEPTFQDSVIPVDFTDTDYFKDVSWTVAYKPEDGTWVSYYSFKPNYYIPSHDFFQTGLNFGAEKETLWTHPMDMASFQVFYGKLEKFIVEFNTTNENTSKLFDSISLNIEAKRWQNQWDYSQNKGIGFNKMVVYNNTQNSGQLNLVQQKTLRDISRYPKTNNDNTQDILFTSLDGKHNINYFYNRVANQNNNVPIWLWNETMTQKEINPQSVNFKGKKLLERMRGEFFTVRLQQDMESRYQIILKNSINSEIVY